MKKEFHLGHRRKLCSMPEPESLLALFAGKDENLSRAFPGTVEEIEAVLCR